MCAICSPSLRARGTTTGKVDGKFGPETRRAVRKFQEAIGITVDGKPGNRTLTALLRGHQRHQRHP